MTSYFIKVTAILNNNTPRCVFLKQEDVPVWLFDEISHGKTSEELEDNVLSIIDNTEPYYHEFYDGNYDAEITDLNFSIVGVRH